MSATLAVTLAVGATLGAGAVGAVLRALAVGWDRTRGTHAVNVVGSLLLALVVAAERRGTLAPWLALALGAGLAGSLTTFSGWMVVLAEGLRTGPLRACVRDLLVPLAAAVAVTVAVFARSG